MILVDSSVWIAHLRGMKTAGTAKLMAIDLEHTDILVGDIILMEVLMGCRDEADAARVHRDLGKFRMVTLGSPARAVAAAAHYRALRRLGFTTRTGIDILIGSWCITEGCRLLHDDRDFAPMEQHLGLRAV